MKGRYVERSGGAEGEGEDGWLGMIKRGFICLLRVEILVEGSY